MGSKLYAVLTASVGIALGAGTGSAAPQARPPPAPTVGATPRFPENYREWVFLSSGLDMSYGAVRAPAEHVFDNVFVDPGSYARFRATGTWPDGTMLVLEIRAAREQGSINRSGHFQDVALSGVEVHVKDRAQRPGAWSFFEFGDDRLGRRLPASADCYACHAEHGAVDTTFVQFYPTLLPIATSKGTLARAYRQGASPSATR